MDAVRETFIQGAHLPDGYQDVLRPYQTERAKGKIYYSFHESSGAYGSYWVKMVVDEKNDIVENFDAMGMKYATPQLK